MSNKNENKNSRKLVTTAILLALLTLAIVGTGTLAWLTIADYARINTMRMDVTSGNALRFDLVPHENFEEYKQMLTSEEIYSAISQRFGFNASTTPLVPLTTSDGEVFTLRNGTVREAQTGAYLTYDLHFMATDDMLVHLTSAHESGRQNGTSVTSRVAGLPDAMRIAFVHEQGTHIYDPGAGNSYTIGENVPVFGLPSAGAMRYNKDNTLFALSAYEDTVITVNLWLEGSDERCTDDLKAADFAVQLRFMGTDEYNNPF